MTLAVGPGDVLDGRYVIERLLGQGGMGAVFVAREEQLGRRVAIKVLLPDVVGNAEAIARFEREARAAASLESDHVTRVLSVGRLPAGAPYIVMELLDGEDLADVLRSRGPMPVHEVIGVIVHACDALAEAHARGIVHRDLKPANLFFARRANGRVIVKVLDFGISKATASSPLTGGLTGTTALMGTPYYMSPEQLREARNVDGRSDIWALGITMYELLAGAPPFVADVLAELCVRVITMQHPPLAALRPDVPPGLLAIIDCCLRKEPGERFATAADLSAALMSLGIPFPGSTGHVTHSPAHPSSPMIHGASPITPQPYASAQSHTAPPRLVPMTVDGLTNTPNGVPAKRSGAAAIVVAVGALVVGAAGALAISASSSSKTAASPVEAGHGDGIVPSAAASATAAPLPSAGTPATATGPSARVVPLKSLERVGAGASAKRAVLPPRVSVDASASASPSASPRVPVVRAPASAAPVPHPNDPPPLPVDRR